MKQTYIEYYPAESGVHDFFSAWEWENSLICPHIHGYPEVLYVREGEMTILLGSERLRVPAGHAVFFLPYEVHAFEKGKENRTLHLMHAAEFVPAFFERTGDTLTFRNRVIDLSEEAALVDAVGKLETGDLLRITGVLNLLYAVFWEKGEPTRGEKKEPTARYRVIGYLSEHFREDITLKSVARALGYHEKYLSEVVSRMTDLHFRQFLNSYRVEYFCRSLAGDGASSKTIASLAAEAGFSDIQTFNRAFKLLKGMTPGEYRAGVSVRKACPAEKRSL